MKKEFINPELEVLRFQRGADVLRCSYGTPGISDTNTPADGNGPALSRKFFEENAFE